MLSVMEQPPADPLSRPLRDGASGAVNSSKAKGPPAASSPVASDAKAAQNGVESISNCDDGDSADTDSKSGAEAGSDAVSADAKSNSGEKSDAAGPPQPAATDSNQAPDAVTMRDAVSASDAANAWDAVSVSGAASASDADAVTVAPVVPPDSDTSGEAAVGAMLDTSARSDLEEFPEEVELRLSGSDGSDPSPEDEDLLLRDGESPSAERGGAGAQHDLSSEAMSPKTLINKQDGMSICRGSN